MREGWTARSTNAAARPAAGTGAGAGVSLFCGICSMHCAPEQLALLLPDGGQHGMLMPWQCIAGVTAAQAAVTVTSQMAVNARARTLETRRWTHPFTQSAY